MTSLAAKIGRRAALVCSAALVVACSDSEAQKSEQSATADAGPGELPNLGATGIGVSDLEKSFDFYTSVVGMTLRYEVQVPDYADEKILYFEEGRGADVVLMNFTDGEQHNYQNNPVRLVFYVPDASAFADSIREYGLEIVSEPAAQPAFDDRVIGLARDPDGYLLEIIEDQKLSAPYLSSVGIGVADLDTSKEFYTRTLGMAPMGELIVVPDLWDEWILKYSSSQGSGLVLFKYTDGDEHDYSDNPIKTVHFVEDSRAATESAEEAGIPVLSPPSMFKLQGEDALISLIGDPDGYVVELITML